MDMERCYVCRENVDSEDLDAIHIAAKYTRTPISALIQDLLQADEPSQFAVNDSICSRCLRKFNQYDLARLTVQRVEADLRLALSKTHIYLKQETTVYLKWHGEKDAVEEDASVVDFSRYQQTYDNEVIVLEANQGEQNFILEEEHIDYLEVDEPLASEESSEERLQVDSEAQSLAGDSNRDDSTVSITPIRHSPKRTEDRSRSRQRLQLWMETIDGNENEVHCKFCKVNVVALQDSLNKHGQSRSHKLKVAARSHADLCGSANSAESVDCDYSNEQVVVMGEESAPETIAGRTNASKHYTQRVREVWKSHPKFENWLQIDDDDNSRVQCKYCDMEITAKKSVLQKHARSKKHIERMNTTFRQNALDEGSTEAGSTASLACPHCHARFPDAKHLKTHVRKLHKSKRCGICSSIFETLSDLRAHQETDHEMGKYVCHICGKELKSAVYLSRHITIHKTGQALRLSGDGLEVFRCDLCGQVEQNATDLMAHIALHDNKLKCVVCGAVVKHKGNLVLHMRIHTGEKFYQCHLCGKDFIHKSSLRMHLATTHTVERKKQCNQCPLSFKTTSQLNQHTLTHTGARNHKCPECGKPFAQRYNMMAHYKLHMGISRHSKKNACPICDITFEKPSQLEQHCTKIHLRAS